ncbi:polysaccharide biosynthesis/export family protein [Zobellia uliginosa]|uniref:polysaccharide biosynthesis/export family protein n=1 Tax=Zobellia uliginosa TaxID=143224 RepID=UPI001C07CDA3|nr:polysaccharide biosynthesis/export family protein [Zobellia uliginosa]MBU2948035.1 polysaccharide export protein [Zobellia uliginosa]
MTTKPGMKKPTLTFFKQLFHTLSAQCIIIVLVTLSLTSCYTRRGVNYLQSTSEEMTLRLRPTEYTVQPNDVLDIKVQSRDPDQAAFFNISTVENRNLQANPASLFLNGYTVNKEGVINLAIVGELEVRDLKVEEIRNLLQTEIDKYLLNAIVSVKLTSFKVSVLGDVRNPGTNYIYNTQATIFEALSAAGDLNISGKRKNVKLIRQKGDKSIVVDLDLTSPDIISSPYYFLHPNDVLYVETSKENLFQKNLGVFSLVLSAISTTILVLSFNSN